ncbi:unnamed protein product [Mytilus coruscus]|uniref:Uncharacterized protein n=1 Tax=Mytilus coruscus TaxID=42192 RepID=A0A6J8BM92_MYTCO|nr:unnamed protein product [Mytilus coruscus]
MSRISSTLGKQESLKSSQKSLGVIGNWRRSDVDIGNYLTDVQKSMPDFSFKKTKSTNKMRKSTGSLAANFNSTSNPKSKSNLANLDNIEAEYIKNLQQQIYFLELESNYLYPSINNLYLVGDTEW